MGGVIAITGRVFLDPTNVSVPSGTELKGYANRRCEFDTGMNLEVSQSGHLARVDNLPLQPGLLTLPLHAADAAAVKLMFRPLTADGAEIGPGNGGVSSYSKVPGQGLLIIPTDPTQKYLYIAGAVVHPATQRKIVWDEERPIFPDNAIIIATGEELDAYPPWWWGTAASIVTKYGLGA